MNVRPLGGRGLLVALSVVGLILYFALDGLAADMFWNVYVLAVLGVAAAATRRLGRHRRAWQWIIAGNLCFLIGDATYSLLDFALGDDPYPSIADVFYLSGYPLLGVGLARLSRTGAAHRDRGAWVDAAIITLGGTALLWVLVMAPTAGDNAVPILDRVVALSYTGGDMILIAGLAVLSGRHLLRGRAFALLMASLVTMLVADVVYAVMSLGEDYTLGNPVDALWWTSYTLLALAVLDPQHADSPKPTATRPPGLTTARSMSLVAAAIVAPVALLVGVIDGETEHAAVLLIATIAIFVLVVGRLQLVAGELDASRRALEHEANHDALTGLANRTRFAHEIEGAAASPIHDVVVLYLDLDDFKTVNDLHGHPVGDAMLVEIADRLRTITPWPDHVARLGGDEFAVLLTGALARSAPSVADELLRIVREPVELPQTVVHPAASVGTASISGAGDVAELMRRADVAMYSAKRAGKDRWKSFEADVGDGAMTWLELRSDLPLAHERDQLTLEFQPVVSVEDGRTVSLEALVRWDHPVHGRIGPDRFIPIAEESRLIDDIGRWVVRAALRAAASAPATDVDISVNVSPRQLEHGGFVDDLRNELTESGFDPGRFIIEVTESSTIDDVDHVAKVLGDIRRLGVRVALDDLGAGFASLRHLGSLPIDIVKLDRSFMRRPMRERDLLPGLVELIRALKLVPVIEGVETPAHHALVRELGVPLAQGYHYGRPVPFDLAWRSLAHQRLVPAGPDRLPIG
jgi:diguanylate cyclase (GGDEF)-like protein